MKASFYAPLRKVEEASDGTLKVEGVASSDALDADGEVITADAMKAVLPDFLKWGSGALREMHGLSAAGTVDKADVKDGKTYIAATVVDPVAITKVKTGTYKGFSVGGKVLKREKNVISALSLTEISLVDRPCNPEAKLTMWKADQALALDATTIRAAMASMSPEERALALMRATHALGVAPATVARALS